MWQFLREFHWLRFIKIKNYLARARSQRVFFSTRVEENALCTSYQPSQWGSVGFPLSKTEHIHLKAPLETVSKGQMGFSPRTIIRCTIGENRTGKRAFLCLMHKNSSLRIFILCEMFENSKTTNREVDSFALLQSLLQQDLPFLSSSWIFVRPSLNPLSYLSFIYYFIKSLNFILRWILDSLYWGIELQASQMVELFIMQLSLLAVTKKQMIRLLTKYPISNELFEAIMHT